MRIGKRKVMAAVGLLAISALAFTAWVLWGTDGLLAATLGTLLVVTLGLGWFVAESQRQVMTVLGEIRSTIVGASPTSDNPHDRAEPLLRAVQAGFVRSDHTLDILVSEWRQAREEMLSSVVKTVEREIGVIGREVGVIGREVNATTSRVESALHEVSIVQRVTQNAPDENPSPAVPEIEE